MKHLLNDLSEEEKNRIREQHTGGKKLVIENFDKLVNTKLGDAKPLLSEEEEMKGAPQTITSKEGDKYRYDIGRFSLTGENLEKRKGLTFDEVKELVKDYPYETISVEIKGETRGWRASLKGSELVLDMITD